MNIIVWVIFGALAGWIASLVAGTDARQGAVANIIVGVLGAFIGGLLMQMLGKSGVNGFNLYSLLVAIGGAVLLLFVYRKATHS
ncbi:MAG: GlsB/YeaQ/YmgE family stress response membrane protein [Candidatus Saccharimonadales bacterium]|jgi:uncharacterized membrane protein YeaQ/YmgE (transglycosylase-associated protein family)